MTRKEGTREPEKNIKRKDITVAKVPELREAHGDGHESKKSTPLENARLARSESGGTKPGAPVFGGIPPQ